MISHSGSSSVDGNTVTWTDIKDSTSGLKAVGERPTGAATAGPSFWKGFGRHGIRGGIIGLIAGIAPTLVISDVRRKKAGEVWRGNCDRAVPGIRAAAAPRMAGSGSERSPVWGIDEFRGQPTLYAGWSLHRGPVECKFDEHFRV
ncbi:hypothetical protein JCM18918_3015 [Cutibacterium acnes JCM 18918]|nr:hypothetical protein JCM18918_3015 [Cutibacterium acnes JCM 18918]